ncbi:MAG: T9SS type A sorting domain-containing protein [Cytophagaceae bacterium]
MKSQLLLIMLLLTLCSNPLFAQVSYGGQPKSFVKSNLRARRSTSESYKIAKIDTSEVNKRIKKAEAECPSCRNSFYGTGIDAKIDLRKQKFIESKEDSGSIWIYNIRADGAEALQFHFEEFDIPEGATLFIYNSDQSMVLGAFTSENNKGKGAWSTQIIEGENIFLEYFEPFDAKKPGKLRISRVIYVFESFLRSGREFGGESFPCHIDVACQLGTGWEKEIRSVGLLLQYYEQYNLSAAGSGAFVNTTRNDAEPYFLTAAHVIYSAGVLDQVAYTKDYSYLVVMLNYQKSLCGGVLNAPTTQSLSGAHLLAIGSAGNYVWDKNKGVITGPNGEFARVYNSDYALLKFYEKAPANYKVCYAGWERNDHTTLASSEFVGIHHPNGDVKKISKSTGRIMQTAINGSDYFYFWRIYWNQGITEKGSSGSPLFNSNHRIVGQLQGGGSFCNINGPDHYGMFSRSYTDGSFSHFLGLATNTDTYCPVYDFRCQNGIKDNGETGIDCGGVCPPCTPTCSDKIKNQNEIGVDCGGVCAPCPETCSDGIKNQNETAIDCGGVCPACPDPCKNGIRNGNETGIDCGGDCRPCSDFCSDNILNGDELDIDCGGSCKPCVNLVFNGVFENHNCPPVESTLSSGFYNGEVCLPGEWHAAFGYPLLKSYPDGNNAMRMASEFFYQDNKYYTKGDGVFYQFPFKLNPYNIYTIHFLYRELNEAGGTKFFVASGLKPSNYPRANTPADLAPPTYSHSRYEILNFDRTGQPIQTNWKRRSQWFTIPNDSYDQFYMYFYGANKTRWIYFDDIILTWRPMNANELNLAPKCSTEIRFVNNNNLPPMNEAKAIFADNNVQVMSGQNITFKGVDVVDLNPGFTSNEGGQFTARLAPCGIFNSGTNYRLSEGFDESNDVNSTIGTDYIPEPAEESGLDLSTNIEFYIYPNPNNGAFYLQPTFKTVGLYEILVLNSLGEIIYRKDNTSFDEGYEEVHLGIVTNGLYLVQIKSETQKQTVKMSITD